VIFVFAGLNPLASGIGLTILPDMAVDHHALRGEWLISRPLAGSAPNRRVTLAWRRSFPHPQALDLLWKSIRQCSIVGGRLV
jgi:LysR family hydrogen peroxide-inducible transcriptional activator